MKPLALLSSMPFESAHILSCLNNVRKTIIGPTVVHRGTIAGQHIILAATGMGKVNAAITSTSVLNSFRVGRIILFGVGGAYPGSGLAVGDVAVASKEVYGDEGVVDSMGWHSLRKIGIPLVVSGKRRFYNEYPLPSLSSPGILAGGDMGFTIKTGAFVTVSAVTGTAGRARELQQRFHAVCENMEGAAVAHLCMLYQIPLLEIRGISNVVGVRDKRKWRLKRAARNAQDVVLRFLES